MRGLGVLHRLGGLTTFERFPINPGVPTLAIERHSPPPELVIEAFIKSNCSLIFHGDMERHRIATSVARFRLHPAHQLTCKSFPPPRCIHVQRHNIPNPSIIDALHMDNTE